METKITPRLDSALRVSAYAHGEANQKRKGGEIPYVMHPFAVMTLASNITDDEDTLIACLLHDILEDVSTKIVSRKDIQDKFGDNVLKIIDGVTKNSEIENWKESSLAYIDHLTNNAPVESIVVALADKTHNLLSTLIDYETQGDDIWLRFTTKSKDDQVWWYKTMEEVFASNLPPSSLLTQYQQYIADLQSL